MVPFLAASLALCAVGADPNQAKSEAEQDLSRLRAYLPVLLQKEQWENDRAYADVLRNTLDRYRVFLEGGILLPEQVSQVEHALLRALIRGRQRETAYRDALDHFSVRFRASAEELKALDAAVLPLTRQFRQYEDIYRERENADDEMARHSDTKKVAELWPVLHRLLAGSAKDKKDRESILVRWAGWEKLPDQPPIQNALNDRLHKLFEKRRKLLDLKSEYDVKNQPLPDADVRRLDDVEIDIDVGTVERMLRGFEATLAY
jgi:hypothetical protein